MVGEARRRRGSYCGSGCSGSGEGDRGGEGRVSDAIDIGEYLDDIYI